MPGEILGVGGMVQSKCQSGILPWDALSPSSVEFACAQHDQDRWEHPKGSARILL